MIGLIVSAIVFWIVIRLLDALFPREIVTVTETITEIYEVAEPEVRAEPKRSGRENPLRVVK